jgi:hypothetical protein
MNTVPSWRGWPWFLDPVLARWVDVPGLAWLAANRFGGAVARVPVFGWLCGAIGWLNSLIVLAGARADRVCAGQGPVAVAVVTVRQRPSSPSTTAPEPTASCSTSAWTSLCSRRNSPVTSPSTPHGHAGCAAPDEQQRAPARSAAPPNPPTGYWPTAPESPFAPSGPSARYKTSPHAPEPEQPTFATAGRLIPAARPASRVRRPACFTHGTRRRPDLPKSTWSATASSRPRDNSPGWTCAPTCCQRNRVVVVKPHGLGCGACAVLSTPFLVPILCWFALEVGLTARDLVRRRVRLSQTVAPGRSSRCPWADRSLSAS